MNAMLQQFNLPNFIDGLSFADASKKIQSRFKERTDPESIATEKEMLDRLKQMQEHVKAQQEAKQEAQNPPQEGDMRIEGSEEEMNQPIEEYSQEEDLMGQIQNSYGGSQYAYGGAYDEEEYDPHAMPDTAEQRFAPTIGAQNESIFSSLSSIGQSVASSFSPTQEEVPETQMAWGGPVEEGQSEYYANNNPFFMQDQPAFNGKVMPSLDPTNNANPEKPAVGIAGKISGGIEAIGAAASLGKEAFGPSNVDTSGRVHVEPQKVGNAIMSGAAKGAKVGSEVGKYIPIPGGKLIATAGSAIIGAGLGYLGAKKQRKAADKANLNATYADAAVNDNQFAEGGEEDDRIKISDNRKIRATTRQRMDPNVDLVSGSYSSKTITDIVNASLKNGVDPNTAIALAMQESKIGNTDENLGHIVGGSYRGQEANDMTKLLSDKMHAGRKLGRKTDEELLQMYNGTGKIFPSTEQEDHGFKMKKAYGVPVGKKGIDMGKTNLYGVQVKDIRDNVIKKDKKIASIVKDLRGNFNHFEGRPYSKADPRTYDDPLGIAPGARDNLNPKMFALGGEEMNQFGDGGNLVAGKINPKTKKRESIESVGTITPAELKKLDKIYKGKDVLANKSVDAAELLKDSNYVKESKLGLIKLPNLGKKQADKMTAMQKLKLAGIDAAEFAGNNKDALRYAPAIGNIMQLANLKKPEQETTPELSTRYKKNVVDEQGLVNLVREETAGNREAILSSSEGSGNAARANLLGTQLNATKALSDAFMKSQEANAKENAQEQSFNLGVDTTNLQQQTLAQDIRAKNKGAYDTEKSKLKTAVSADLGSIGQEELYKKFPELMGMDYGAFGEYLKLKEKQKKAK